MTGKNRWITVGVLLYVLLGVVLFATREKETEGGQKTLQLAIPSSHVTEGIYRELIREFEAENPDVKIKLITGSAQNFYQKIMVMIAGNAAPDLMWMGQSFREFADKDVFLDLAPYIRRDGLPLDRYAPEVLRWYESSGKIYSLPFGIDLSMVVYNRRMFAAANLPMPRDDWEFPEFLEAARRLTRRSASGAIECYGFGGNLEPGVFGASVFEAGTGKIGCDAPEMLDYFRSNLELFRKWRVSPSPEESQNMIGDAVTLFRQGRMAMIPLQTQNMPIAFEQFQDMEFGITLQPKVKQQSQWASSQAICVCRGTRYPEEAWRFFKMTQRKKFQLAMSIRSLPGRLDCIDEALKPASAPPNYAVLKKAFAVMTPTPRVPHLQELMAVFTRFSGKIFVGQLSPEEGMAACRKEMERRVELFRKTDMGEAQQQ